ncbi:MAG: ABC transporter ATP-binding protein [Planctomycetota bacterium]
MNNTNKIILKIDNVSRSFKIGNSSLEILKNVSLEIKESEILSIIGPSGAGKSTLLHAMGLLDRPTSGHIFFKGEDIYSLPISKQAKLRNSSFAFVFQFYHLLPELNILENVLLPHMISNSIIGWQLHSKALKEKAKTLIVKLGLEHRLSHKPTQLSGGERQRVAIARALVTDPEIILCDEPTGNLDSNATSEIHDLILDLNGHEGKTFIIVTHNDNVARWAHRIINLVDGQIVNNKE